MILGFNVVFESPLIAIIDFLDRKLEKRVLCSRHLVSARYPFCFFPLRFTCFGRSISSSGSNYLHMCCDDWVKHCFKSFYDQDLVISWNFRGFVMHALCLKASGVCVPEFWVFCTSQLGNSSSFRIFKRNRFVYQLEILSVCIRLRDL